MSASSEPAKGEDMLETKGSIEYTDTEASQHDRARVAAVWRKMDWVVLPVVTMIYFLSSLVRLPLQWLRSKLISLSL
ncbi:hypothetical protein TRAPUB_4185 [Trametes pubescens]|uniref:Uncharacterized protein n=1 Tax=Trametes pubescens TaxID=154538 RepID=A0A1M2VBQ7_TRAPU|nr:hypothetical protein TRAPUB_4185 [Trametes pubescens]